MAFERELKQARFWDADGNQKWALFTFNLSSHKDTVEALLVTTLVSDQL